jgi:hypothetical protein
MNDRPPRPGEPNLNLLEGPGLPARKPMRWDDMTPIQKAVVVVVLTCLGALAVTATVTLCVLMGRAVL